jgi:hypothetical protein
MAKFAVGDRIMMTSVNGRKGHGQDARPEPTVQDHTNGSTT